MRPYERLRRTMHAHGVSGEQIGRLLGMNRTSASSRLTGRTPWSLDEMYLVMDLLDIPHDQMHLYFTRNGEWVQQELTIRKPEVVEAIKEAVSVSVATVMEKITKGELYGF